MSKMFIAVRQIPMNPNDRERIISMSIYTKNLPHIPYFYIIEHIYSGKKYAGAKWSGAPTKFSRNGCHPLELLHPSGYHTSSETINAIITEEGLEAFKILEIIEETCMNGLSAYEYESKFLQDNDIAGKQDCWFNKHNNLGTKFCDREHYAYIMLERYGVDHPTKSLELLEKGKLTCQKNYGVDSPAKSPTVQEKMKSANRKLRGVDYAAQAPEVIAKAKSTRVERYGVEHMLQDPACIEKQRLTMQQRHSVDNFGQTDTSKHIVSERMAGSKFYNDGIKNYRVKPNELPDASWELGFLIVKPPLIEETKDKIRQKIQGSKWYNDGIRNYYVKANELPDKSWELGMMPKIRHSV